MASDHLFRRHLHGILLALVGTMALLDALFIAHVASGRVEAFARSVSSHAVASEKIPHRGHRMTWAGPRTRRTAFVPQAFSSCPSNRAGTLDRVRKGIQQVGPNEYTVARDVVDPILQDQADLMRFARIVPEQVNGRVTDIRLFGIRPDTVLGVLGFENGDRLFTINGFDMTDPESALSAYARLRSSDDLTVHISRGGTMRALRYHIV
jgi:hypothetical protein